MMPRILVVDDDADKVRELTAVIFSVNGYDSDCVEYVGDALSAKRKLAEHKYGLVILDINVPPRPNERPEIGGGLAVLSFITNNHKAIRPDHLLGVTAFDESFVAASNVFESPLWKLIKYSPADNSWKSPLRTSLEFLKVKNRPPYFNDGHSYHYDLGIFVGLEGVELDSILALDADWHELRIQHDPTRYFEGQFKKDNHSIRVIAAAAPKMGMPAAAVVSAKLVSAFRPRYLAITGICAGVKGKAAIGDVLVADPCFDWGSGKWVTDRQTKRVRFKPAQYQLRIDEDVRTGVRRVAKVNGLLHAIWEDFEGKKPITPPRVLIDAMGSGGSVIQSSQVMADVVAQHKNLIGVEMEAYAVMSAAALLGEPRPKVVSIKAVCDFGNERKHDGYQAYAACVSARFLFELAMAEFKTTVDIDED